MISKKNFKNSIISLLGIVAFAAVTMFTASCEKDDSDSLTTNCEDVDLTCSKTPYTFQACVSTTGGGAWWELNGTRYDNLTEATQAYLAYCN